jgi:hypothetical protein
MADEHDSDEALMTRLPKISRTVLTFVPHIRP